jgi:hypothetical protein
MRCTSPGLRLFAVSKPTQLLQACRVILTIHAAPLGPRVAGPASTDELPPRPVSFFQIRKRPPPMSGKTASFAEGALVRNAKSYRGENNKEAAMPTAS